MSIRRRQYGKNHGYTINGATAMGVTTAISEGFPKPALMGWAARCVAEEAADMVIDADNGTMPATYDGRVGLVNYLKGAPTRKRNEAAVRGTRVHKLAEQVINGDTVDCPIELMPHVESVVAFLDQWKVRPLLVEKVIGSYTFHYAGTFDLIGELPTGERVLFDYKTGASGIHPETAIQLAAYRHADMYVADDGTEMPLHEVGIDSAKAVWVRADGYDVIPLETGNLVFKAFLNTLLIARARRELVGSWVGQAQHYSDYLKDAA